MNRWRPVIMMLGLAIILLNTGDCVNLAFADVKAADCCLQGDCPLAGAPQMDSCCKSPVSPAQYIQAPAPQSVSHPSVKDVEFPVEVFAVHVLTTAANSSLDRKFESPPSGLKTSST